MKSRKLVSIIMGSDSDLPCMKKAAEVLEKAQVPFEVRIVSAHRTPQAMQKYALSAKKRGIKVIIAGAGRSRSFAWHGCLSHHTSRHWGSH